MILIIDSLYEKTDEGSIKVVNSLTRRIKSKSSATTVLSYGKKTDLSDIHLKLNKLFLNPALFSVLRNKRERILYIPASSNTRASIFRTFVLALSGLPVSVLFVLLHPMDWLSRTLLKWSAAEIITLSADSYRDCSALGNNHVLYLKTGVDTDKFTTVDVHRKMELRRKYGFSEDQKIILHVGHMKEGRNLRCLLQIPEMYHLCLVISTHTEREETLRTAFEARKNTTIIDTYIDNIEEIYQLADAYIFPVEKSENCIDIPLSVLEAAACGLSVLSTRYGEIKAFEGKAGFFFIDSFAPDLLAQTLAEAIERKYACRQAVMEYDWNNAVSFILNTEQ